MTRLVPGPLEPFVRDSSPAAGSARRRRRRERDQRRRFVDRVAATVARLADARGWERLLVSGPDRLTGPLVAALPTSLIESVIRDSRHLVELDSLALAAAVDERLEAEHSQREVQLAQATLDGASGAAGVALGLSEVLAALNNARVAHLVAVYVSIAATPSFSRGDRECTGHERATRAGRLLRVLERGGQVLEAAVHPIGHAPPPVRVANRRADLHRLGRAPLHRDIGDAQFADRRLHASQYGGQRTHRLGPSG